MADLKQKEVLKKLKLRKKGKVSGQFSFEEIRFLFNLVIKGKNIILDVVKWLEGEVECEAGITILLYYETVASAPNRWGGVEKLAKKIGRKATEKEIAIMAKRNKLAALERCLKYHQDQQEKNGDHPDGNLAYKINGEIKTILKLKEEIWPSGQKP